MHLDAFERSITPSAADILAEQRAEGAAEAYEQARELIRQARELLSEYNHEFEAAFDAIDSAATEVGL